MRKIAQEEYTKTETLLIPRIKDLQNQIANVRKSRAMLQSKQGYKKN